MRLFDTASTVTTAEAAEWGYARQILLLGRRLRPADYEACRRALMQIGAIPVSDYRALQNVQRAFSDVRRNVIAFEKKGG